jgi:cobalt-zinc-cadmium efflux system outer membrane protein
MDLQLQIGNVSIKDNLRIKALLFSLQNELVSADAQMIPLQNEIKLLLNNNETKFIAPALEYRFGELTTATVPNTDTLVQQALSLRPDAKIAQTSVALQNHNLSYQKALAKPDISVGTEFDQRSSYAPNYVGLAISLPLNIFNRNQGNIASAKFSIQQQQAVSDQAYAKIKNDILSAVNKFIFYQGVNNRQQLDFSQQYDTLFSNMLKSYQDRQLSLLEFIDFMDAYKDTKLKIVEQHNGLVHAAADLNYAAGNDIIKLN